MKNEISKTNIKESKINNKKTTMEQKEINFFQSLYNLRMSLIGVGKNLNGYGYKYQDFNEILREVKNVIKESNLDIDFVQCPTIKSFEGKLVNVITTTFYSPNSGYRYEFDTPIYTEELNSMKLRSQNTLPQLVGSCITYFKRYALVAFLSIESEVDTDASDVKIEQGNNQGNSNTNYSRDGRNSDVNGQSRDMLTKQAKVANNNDRVVNVKTNKPK
uniref:ERF family protein n=1 Tax=Borrelia persica TaxID=44448 RepID=UPI0004630673